MKNLVSSLNKLVFDLIATVKLVLEMGFISFIKGPIPFSSAWSFVRNADVIEKSLDGIEGHLNLCEVFITKKMIEMAPEDRPVLYDQASQYISELEVACTEDDRLYPNEVVPDRYQALTSIFAYSSTLVKTTNVNMNHMAIAHLICRAYDKRPWRQTRRQS